MLWFGDEIGGRSEFVESRGGWDETTGGLASGRELTMVFVDDVTDDIDNEGNDVITVFTFGGLLPGFPGK